MSRAFERPFRPIHLEPRTFESFPVREMAEQLRGEKTFAESGRDALVLVHDKGLSVVLTVARKGTACDPHHEPGPTTIIGLSGTVRIRAEELGKTITVDAGSAAAVAPHVDQVIEAVSDAVFLTIIGEQ